MDAKADAGRSRQYVDLTVFVEAPAGRKGGGGLIGDLQRWDNPAGENDRQVISNMSSNVYAMGEATGRKAARGETPPSADTIFSFLVHRGRLRLESLRAVKAIESARDAVLESGGSDELTWFDDFPFEVPCGHSGRRNRWVRVCKEDRTGIAKLATALGLTSSKVAQLAIVAVLLDVDLDAADHAFLQMLLDDFMRRVGMRAKEAHARAFAVEAPQPKRKAARQTFAALKKKAEGGK
ncbi:MAG: hypothetical protein IT180_04700 [Acidobacteria bacterium]|nr:hypothetical protein [Acidobacteriota bacterium]